MRSLIGIKIKTLRKSLNLSQQELSSSIISRTIISKIENNKIVPSIYQLNYLAKILGVTMEYFIDEEPDIFLDESDDNLNLSINYLYNHEKYYAIISYYEKSLIHFNRNINYWFYIGMSYYKTEFYEESKKLLLKFIKEFEKLHIPEKKYYVENCASALNSLSFILMREDNKKKSISYIVKAKNLLEAYSLRSLRLYYVLINNLSTLYNQTNNFKKSIKDLEEFLKDLPELVNLKMIASIHLNLNICYYNLSLYDKSIFHIKSSINLFEYSNNLYQVKGCYLNYINALRYNQKYEEALEILEKFNEKYPNDLEDSLKKEFSIQVIILYFNMGNYDKVLSLMSKVNHITFDAATRHCFFLIKGHINFLNKDYEKSKSSLLACFKFFSESTYIYDLKVIYEDLYAITGEKNYSQDTFKKLYNKITPRKNIFVV